MATPFDPGHEECRQRVCSRMSSQAEIVEVLAECSSNLKLPTWLSVSCVFDKDKNIHNGDEGIIRANSEEGDNSYIIDLVNEDIPRKYPLILKI